VSTSQDTEFLGREIGLERTGHREEGNLGRPAAVAFASTLFQVWEPTRQEENDNGNADGGGPRSLQENKDT
jgi:hypothetical protein